MGGIFISYRREDSAGFAGRLADALEAEFGAGSVFRDVDDIHPGEDFVAAIQRHLERVDSVLVMIGPRWLVADAQGRRRLDEPDDFVRREIEAALATGKPLIPVLVGGAVMPAEADLPAAIAGLARRQALNLDDTGWHGDLARLVAALRPLVSTRRTTRGRHGWAPRALAAVLGLFVLAWAVRSWLPMPDAGAPEQHAVTARIDGRWLARVRYGWGAEHLETFDFRMHGGEVFGSAGYLRLPRGITEGRLQGGRLSFTTHSEEILGDAPARRVSHRYVGEVRGEQIHFVLQSGGGYTIHPPVEFVARRARAG